LQTPIVTDTIFSFEKTTFDKPMLIPNSMMTPFNAQATIHFKAAFFAMYLPVSVPGITIIS
jgi:hypothetical protein